ncbi:MAG: hypothetical protein LBQ22_13140 [Bacteroidales bacterium]|jgi:hypothetical protein|nr:hypothetical protein [Bacteroidales bacterium]
MNFGPEHNSKGVAILNAIENLAENNSNTGSNENCDCEVKSVNGKLPDEKGNILLNAVDIVALPEVIGICYNTATNENTQQGIQITLSRPAPANCYLQIARRQELKKKYNKTSRAKYYRIMGRKWAVESLTSKIYYKYAPSISIPEGATVYIIPVSELNYRFRPCRCSGHQKNTVYDNRRNTAYFKFCISTYTKGNYKQGKLSNATLCFKQYYINPKSPDLNNIENIIKTWKVL